MKPLAAVALRALFLILLAMAAGFAASQPAGASDTYWPDWWWVDLKPWGDGSISYALCAIPYELPPEWEQGVENWDAAMADFMEFDLEWGGCYAAADTILAWELGNECVYDDIIACAWPMSWVDHGTWWEMKRVHICFDHDWYYNLGPWQEAWQVAVSAHEWGHVVNLATELRDQCTVPHVIMGVANLSAAPCVTGPTPAEVSAVIMNYGLFDSDGDGFTDAAELYMGTDPYDDCPDDLDDDAWPPDVNGGGGCSVTHNGQVDILDVLCFKGKLNPDPYDHRYDLNADGVVNILDVLLYKPIMQTQCTNPPG